MILPDRGQFRQGPHLPAGDGDDPLDELPDAAVLCRDHRDDREPRDFSSASASIRIPCVSATSSMFTATIDRRAEEEEFREEVEAPLEGGGVHQKDDDVGRSRG